MKNSRCHWIFLAGIVLLLGANAKFLRELVEYSVRNGHSSHILLIPLITAVLLFRNRDQVLSRSAASPGLGIPAIALGITLSLIVRAGSGPVSVEWISLAALAFVICVFGLYLLAYGTASFGEALFPLLFLLFLIPFPEPLLNGAVVTLQKGSAEMAGVLFKLTSTAHYREGMMFVLPGLTIEVAEQCSGIRSSMALLITCLLAGYLMLETSSRRLIFILLVVPVAMFKNAVRIVSLSLLAIHIDSRILTSSSLHRDGGILFFVLALLLMSPILWILRRSERRAAAINR